MTKRLPNHMRRDYHAYMDHRDLDHIDRCWDCHGDIVVYTERTIRLCAPCTARRFPQVRIIVQPTAPIILDTLIGGF